MEERRKIKNALISVYYKDGLDQLVKRLHQSGINIFSTGGTQTFIEQLNIPVIPVEDLTSYPSILGGRVKTLHPKIFGGILGRRALKEDVAQMEHYEIPSIDLVIVDLYPFQETLAKGGTEKEIIEKIDIGGISLIRAAAKNFNDVLIVSSRDDYPMLKELMDSENGSSTLAQRKAFAARAFAISSDYDTAIFKYFNAQEKNLFFKQSEHRHQVLRYGENPHQKGVFYGDLNEIFEKLGGKELSYNNLLDVDAAVNLIADFEETTFAILKHNNACGIASRNKVFDAWSDALASDPVSAFGGILITNAKVDQKTADSINKIFFEVIIAPEFDYEALEILKSKANRIILKQKKTVLPDLIFRTLLNGVIEQERDSKIENESDLKLVTKLFPSPNEMEDLLFANKVVKHTKSNTIVLAKGRRLIASGTGQTSRVDALQQAIQKAKNFKFDLNGAVMASDAFFPFADCVEIANNVGIKAVIQPGGSIKDKDSIEYCNSNDMKMVFTGIRHFKH